jgi:hypothetical protein
MKRKTAKKKKDQINKKHLWIYIRYLLPIIFILLTVVSLFIPCFLYTTVEGVDDDVYSLMGVLSEYWDPVCNYAFFSVGDLNAATLKFSQTFIVSLIVFSVLFTVAAVSTVYVAVNVFRYFKNNEEKGNSRILFLTLVPNRIVAFLWQLPCVPFLLFPRYVIYMFKTILGESATLTITFPEPIIIWGILYIISIVISIATASMESAQGMNPFAKKKVAIDYDDEEDDE